MIPISTTAEAESALADLRSIVEKLSGLLQQETALVRAGHLRKATEIGPAKAELSGRLIASGERVKANARFVLRRRRRIAPPCATCSKAFARCWKKI